MNKLNFISVIFFMSIFLFSCEKEIDVDLPTPDEKLVVEGVIETGTFPYVVLSKSSAFFDPTDIQSVASSYVSDATITISDGTTTNTMTKLCSGTLTDPQKEQLGNLLGIPLAVLQNFNICGYTDLTMLGEVGKTYSITIDWKGEEYKSSTTIVPPVALDSTWFEVFGERDSLGFIYAYMTEPATEGNAYRWFARRINKYDYGPNVGEVKDARFLPPTSSVFDDEFVNGTSFEFAYNRARGSDKPDDVPPERSFFKVGDTVVVKFCSIDRKVHDFIDKAEEQQLSTGNPFAAPINIKSNISNGALGLWAGYSPFYDTVVCKR